MNPDHLLLTTWTAPVSAAGCSPLADLLSLRVDDVDRDVGRVRLGLVVPASLRRPDGACTMQAVAAGLDFALGFAAMACLAPPEAIVTATLRIESVAETWSFALSAVGEVVGRNDLTLFARASLHDETGRLVALASATLRRVQGRR